jgi:uncharacterized protein YkwD
MNKPKKTKDSSKELSTFFKFFLFVQIVIGVVFLLNGPIKSNFGYEPVDAAMTGRDKDDRGGEKDITPQQPRVIQPQNLDALKQNWTVPQTPQTQRTFIDNLEKQIFIQSNTQRTGKNLPAVTWEDNLAVTARFHSSDMGTRSFFSHINPDNIGPFFRISKLHRRYIGTVGENIVKITKDSSNPGIMAKKIVNLWMNSTGHRQNILNKDYTTLGVGVVETTDPNNIPILYATQLFGKAAAYLQHDFPVELTTGQEENVAVQCVHNNYFAPLAGEVVELDSRQVYPFQLTEDPKSSRMVSTGKIRAPSKAGVYQLVFQFPLKKNPGTLAVTPGPIFTVK